MLEDLRKDEKVDRFARQLEELGITVKDKEGNIKNLWDIFVEISELDLFENRE